LKMALNIEKFLAQFFLEASEKVQRVENKLIELENNPNDEQSLLAIQRDMHTVKGSARMVGLAAISQLAHRLEDIFSYFSGQRGLFKTQFLEKLYQVLDVLKTAIEKRKDISEQEFGECVKKVEEIKTEASQQQRVPEESFKEQTGTNRKVYSIDFNTLKKRIASLRPDFVEKEKSDQQLIGSKIEKKDVKEIKEERVAPNVESSGEVKTEKVVERDSAVIHGPVEKSYIKIEADRLNTSINQITDLLAKKYFFSNVLKTFQTISRLAESIHQEISLLTNSSRAFYHQDEQYENIKRSFELFQKTISDFERQFQLQLNNFESGLKDIYDNLLDLKLTPIMNIFELFPRFVRDFAQKNNKKIKLYMRGGDTQLDKTIIEKINEPLIHLIRNACDHGIESPEERLRAGKEETGTIILEANKKGNRIEIKISDDGRGLNRNKIVEKAVQNGLISAEKASQLDDQEIFQFIFETGFSTAEKITETSGRGIGMDIVRRVLQELGGTVAINSISGKGTTFCLEFPIAIFTNRVLFIREGNRMYALLSSLIRGIVRVKGRQIKVKSDFYQVVVKNEVYVVAKLEQIILKKEPDFSRKDYYLIFPKNSEKKIALVVDQILNEDEVIIKECGPFLGKVKYVSGLIIAENGDLITVLDFYDLISSGEFARKYRLLQPVKTQKEVKKKILVVDDSLLVREMEKNLLESNGFDVVTAINGLDGYNRALTENFDLILADIEMPEMDGFEMIEKLRSFEQYSRTPIIVLSTRDREEDRIRGVKSGANAWLQKQNFDESEFLRLVRSFLD